MANNDDKNLPPINQSSLDDINRRAEKPLVAESEAGKRAGEAQTTMQTLREVLETNKQLGLEESPTITAAINKAKLDVKKFGSRARQMRARRLIRAQDEALSATRRELGSQSVNGQIRELGQDYRIHQESMSMINESDDYLQDRQDTLRRDAELRRQTASELISSGKYYDQAGRVTKTGRETMKSIYSNQQKDIQELAKLEKAQSLRRKLGMDETSLDIERGSATENAKKISFQEAIKSGEVKIGGQSAIGMSAQQLENEKIEASKKMIDIWRQITENNPAKDMKKLREEFDKLSKTVGTAEEALSLKKEKTQSSIQIAAQVGELALQGFNAYKFGFRQDIRAEEGAGINMALAAKNNAIAGAQLSNKMWDLRQSAISGDMTALFALTGGLKEGMNLESANLSGLQKQVTNKKIQATEMDMSLGAGIGKIAIDTIKGAGIGAVGGAVAAGIGAIPGAIVGGGFGAISSTMDVVSSYKAASADKRILEANKTYGVDANSINLQAQGQTLNLELEQRYVTGQMTQKLYNYGQGMRQASLVAGGNIGRNIINEFSADKGAQGGLLNKLEIAGINPEQFAQLATQGAAQQGSVFNTNQIFNARALEKAGVGTIQENMMRISALGAAGSNNPQAAFGSVLEAAFSKSLDSSKAINMMVENTAAMVESGQGAAIGMDTSKAAAGLLSSLVDPNMQNKEAALRSAISTERTLNEQRSSIGANFTDMVGLAQISRTSGLSSRGAMALKQLHDETADTLRNQLESYQKMTPNEKSSEKGKTAQKELRDVLYRTGLGESIDEKGNIRDAGGLISGLKERSLSFLNQGVFLGTNLQGAKGFDELRSGKLTYEELTAPNSQYKELADKLSSASALGKIDMKQLIAAITQGNDPNISVTAQGTSKAIAASAGIGGTKSQQELDKQATAQATEFATQAREAARQMGGVSAAMGTITIKMTELVKQLNDNTSASMQGAAADAAKQFYSGADTFSRAVDKFAGTQGIRTAPVTPIPQQQTPQQWKLGPKY
jgi:hypothetical protein